MVEKHAQHLLRRATELGVSDARLIDAARIRVEDDLAAICKDPGCPGYGQGANCPPHVMKPEAFRNCCALTPGLWSSSSMFPLKYCWATVASSLPHRSRNRCESRTPCPGMRLYRCARVCGRLLQTYLLFGRNRLPGVVRQRGLPTPGSGPSLHFRAGRQFFRTFPHRRLADSQDYQ